MPYSQSVEVRCKLEDVKLISGSIQWPTGGQCDDWHFMPLTRRSTEGILDVVSEQTKHTGISFLCFDVILICQFVPEYAMLAINLSLLQHNTAISNSTRSTEKNGFYGRKTLIFASLLKISQIASLQSR